MLFERFDERKENIEKALRGYGFFSISEALDVYQASKIDVDAIIDGIQPFACNDARYAFKFIVAVCKKHDYREINEIASCIGNILQSFCVPGSIAQKRNIGLGHGALAKALLAEENNSFAFVAGHESFAAAEGALSIAKYANECREMPLKVVLLGLGKATAEIIARYQGFEYIQTLYNHENSKLVVNDKPNSVDKVRCFGANSVDEGVAILHYEDIRIIMTGNSTNHVKFTDPTVAIYKKECHQQGKVIYCIASGGGTGRTMHPDNVQAGAASYGMTDTLGRTHSDIQFAGSSSVPSHVQMVGFIGIGNNPLVGLSIATIAAIKK